jgi:hypothetical protein
MTLRSKSQTERPYRSLRFILRVVGLGVCGLLVAASISVGAAGTACACSCRGYTTEEAASQASGVFVARVTDKVSAGLGDIYEVAVLEVFKGEVGAITTVGTSSSEGASCGVSYQVGGEYLLFVSDGRESGRAWESGLCHGPSSLSSVDVRPELERIYGPPQPPNSSVSTPSLSAGEDAQSSWWTRATAAVPLPLMALAGAIFLAGIWWTTVTLRRRRPRQ